MSLILHLSDLHLGMAPSAETLGDHKSPVIAAPSRMRRSVLIESTLRELGTALAYSGRKLAAVVVSGDITNAGNPAGFMNLPPLLSALGDALPEPPKILVVPGNHDVAWSTPESSAERYEAFVVGVRSVGYTTPYLEGVDIGPDGTLSPHANSPVVVADDGSFVLVGLNSANHCGVQQEINEELAAHIADLRSRETPDPAVEAVLASWADRGRFDIARIDPWQLSNASEALRAATAACSGPVPPTRFAVMHHQLLPVSIDEEVKPFEALTNLAEVREWLAGNDIKVVMHGHKHVGALTEDRFRPTSFAYSPGRTHRVLISSSATVGLGQGRTGELAKLFDLDTALPTLRRMTVKSIPAINSGIPLDLAGLPAETRITGTDSSPSDGLIRGATINEVHEQLLAEFEPGRPQTASPLICRINHGITARSIPDSYQPAAAEHPLDTEWFGNMIALWQRPRRLTSMPFNHGERIHTTIDQISEVIATLYADRGSSRAVISILNRATDRISDRAVEFPAFCLAQFVITGGKIHVFGYFRKQEMRYWWAVNAGELADLQRQVIDGLHQCGARYEPGAITTMTAVPVAGEGIPRVAVPIIDRLAEDEPARLLLMALWAHNPILASASDAEQDWLHLLDQCRDHGLEAADGSPVPLHGLAVLKSHLQTLRVGAGATGSDPLAESLDHLYTLNQTYHITVRNASPQDRRGNRDQANQLADRIGAIIAGRAATSRQSE